MSPKKVFMFALLFVLVLSACGVPQADYNALQTQIAALTTPTPSVQELQTQIAAMLTPTAQSVPTQSGVAAAYATPQSVGYQLASFCYSAEKLGISFPVNREMAYQMFVGKSAGDTVTRPDDMTPLLTDGTNLLYGWTYSRHGGSSEPVVTVTNPTLFMQNGWIHDSDLRSLYGYTLQEAGILDAGRNVTGAGIPGLAQNVRVEGFTFLCAPPSADKGAVLPGHHLVNERSTANLIQQLPLP